jgi:predicted polyphosphate/ATP-dependent NAD kinase
MSLRPAASLWMSYPQPILLDHAGVPRLLATDATEARLLELLDAPRPALDLTVPPAIIVTVIGGQGYIFGRGNQQLSPDVIGRVGRDHIRVIATRNKINGLPLHRLRVDTGDQAVDELLRGYVRVVVSDSEEAVLRVV